MASALFIHEQGVNFDSKKQTQSNSSMIGTISNQHIWNFKPSLSTKLFILDMLYSFAHQASHVCLQLPKVSKIFL